MDEKRKEEPNVKKTGGRECKVRKGWNWVDRRKIRGGREEEKEDAGSTAIV